MIKWQHQKTNFYGYYMTFLPENHEVQVSCTYGIIFFKIEHFLSFYQSLKQSPEVYTLLLS